MKISRILRRVDKPSADVSIAFPEFSTGSMDDLKRYSCSAGFADAGGKAAAVRADPSRLNEVSRQFGSGGGRAPSEDRS